MQTVDDPDVAAVLDWFDAHGRDLPWRATRDTYAVWVAEVMAQQTSAERAAEYWRRWMARWPTVEMLAAASLAEVLEAWQGLGYPRRARDLHRGAALVSAGGWPGDLRTLPGVGPYTDAAIRCFAWEQPVLPPDVNVRRVLARRFPDGVDTTGAPWRAGQALMELGARVCQARPRCGECPVSEGCPSTSGRSPLLSNGNSPLVSDPAPRARRQARYEGSFRQRRGELLRRVLASGAVDAADADPQAAESLVADGLLRRDGERLTPPD